VAAAALHTRESQEAVGVAVAVAGFHMKEGLVCGMDTDRLCSSDKQLVKAGHPQKHPPTLNNHG
jgi:hypothetical protein